MCTQMMKKTFFILVTSAYLALIAQSGSAESFSTVESVQEFSSQLNAPTKKKVQIDRFYGGFGFSDHNSSINTTPDTTARGDALGFAVFAGYTLPFQPTDYTKISIEAGYLSTENFEWDNDVGTLSSADAILASALLEFNLIGQWQLLGRAGYDFGDDQSDFFGAGVGYVFHNGLNLRTEYLEQDKIDTLQINLTMRVKDILF